MYFLLLFISSYSLFSIKGVSNQLPIPATREKVTFSWMPVQPMHKIFMQFACEPRRENKHIALLYRTLTVVNTGYHKGT